MRQAATAFSIFPAVRPSPPFILAWKKPWLTARKPKAKEGGRCLPRIDPHRIFQHIVRDRFSMCRVRGVVSSERGTGLSAKVCILALQAVGAGGLSVLSFGLPGHAQDVRIAEDLPHAEIAVGGLSLRIERAQDPAAMLTGEFARTSRACPPFCVQPAVAAPGVVTVGELELIAFLQQDVAAGTGIVIDARLPEWHAKGTIPGAVNVPFLTLSPDNPFRQDLLVALGAVPTSDGQFDFSSALDVTAFCNGAWSDQAPRAIRLLLEAGYPSEKLRYYRGGMQDWQVLGLTVAPPGQQG